MNLNKIIPDKCDSISRLTMVRLDYIIKWLQKNKSPVMNDAMKACGYKMCKEAFDELNKGTMLWR